MKNLLFILLFFGVSTLARGQTIDTAFKAYPSCKIIQKNVMIPGSDTLKCTRILITHADFDFSSKAIDVKYSLCLLDGTALYNNDVLLTGIDFATIITGVQNLKAVIFSYLGTKLNLTYQ